MRNPHLAEFFGQLAAQGIRVTYGDVRLETNYSNVLPTDTDVRTKLSRRINLNIPIVSSPMDTVTSATMAIAMAEAGGIGIIHRLMTPDEQARKVWRVKNKRHGLITTPTTTSPHAVVGKVLASLQQNKETFRTLPVVNDFGDVVGLVTGNDFDFCLDTQLLMHNIMTPAEDLVMASKSTTPSEAFEIMLRSKKKVLLRVDGRKLYGMYLFSDLKGTFMPTESDLTRNVDVNGQLLVGAAVGAGKGALERAELLAAKQCDVFQIDTAHGDSETVIATLRELKRRYPHIDVLAGNVSNGDSARRLADAGADAVLVGQGPGSICTTRIVAGIGTPQVSAIYSAVRALEEYDVPVIADGGIGNSGDMVIALAVGSLSVMLGRLLAGTDEAPGETKFLDGRAVRVYRGMGSSAVMQANSEIADKYGQGALTVNKRVPEGIEGVVANKGPVSGVLHQYVGGIRAGLGYTGGRNLAELRAEAILFRMSDAGLRESHPHDVIITADAPNYSR